MDSAGNIYAGDAGTIWKSADGGKTWVNKYTISGSPNSVRCCFVDSRDYIYLSGWIASDTNATGNLLRSTDGGDTFSQVIDVDDGTCIWGIDEDSSGNLFAGQYSFGETGKGIIWRSTDGGATWSIVYQASETAGIYHIHDLRINPANDWIYASTGDAIQRLLRSKDGGDTWTAIKGDDGLKFLAMTFLNGIVYLGTDDFTNGVYQLDDDGSDTPTITMFYEFPTGSNDYVFGAASYNGKMVFITFETTDLHNIWLYDGASWSSLESFDAGGFAENGYHYISHHHRNGVFYVHKKTPAGKQNGLAVDLN